MKKALWVLPLLAPFLYAGWVLWLDARGVLPELLASHWGLGGEPDGFATVQEHLLWSMLALFLASGLLSAALGFKGIHQALRKLLLAIVGFASMFIYGLMIFVIVAQIGISDPASVKLSPWIILVMLPVVALVPMMLKMPNIVIGKNLRVELAGVPFVTLQFAEIESVSEEFVKPSQFGGWGLRYANGKVAFIPSKGPALRIHTKSGEVILVRSNQVQNLIAAVSPKL